MVMKIMRRRKREESESSSSGPTNPRTIKLAAAGLALVLSAVLGKDVFTRITEFLNAFTVSLLP